MRCAPGWGCVSPPAPSTESCSIPTRTAARPASGSPTMSRRWPRTSSMGSSTTRRGGRWRPSGGGSTPTSTTGEPTAGRRCGRCTPSWRTPCSTWPRRSPRADPPAGPCGQETHRSSPPPVGTLKPPAATSGRSDAPVALVVQKYGGSSVSDADGIKRVAQRIVASRKAGHSVVVVVSAMGDTTDDLHDLAKRVSPLPPARELDMLLTSGERISMALLAMAIANLGLSARSYTGSQAGVITDDVHGKARIIDVTPGRIAAALADGSICIVAGFQGVTQDSKDITTLGRGGTDTTAVALAAALEADVCEIYTDVDGVFTADPRIVPTARRIPAISYEEMMEMAASGAKVLQLRCVEYARRYAVPIHVRSSFSNRPGTW